MKTSQLALGIFAAAFIGLSLMSADLIGQEPDKAKQTDASQLDLKTTRVVVFKDGYCLVLKTGTAKTDAEGFAFTDEVPDAAVLGSFWAIPETGTIRSMTAGWVEDETESTRERVCQQTIDIIRANVDKKCSFLIDGDTKLSGVILGALTEPTDVALPQPTAIHLSSQLASSSAAISTLTSVRQTGDQFVLKTGAGDMLIQASQIRQLTIDDMQTKIEETIKERTQTKRLKLKFAEANADVAISLIYFRPGFRWIPTYRVDLTNEFAEVRADKPRKGKADLKEEGAEAVAMNRLANISLQGELINEAEDLIDMPIDVVVGVPNFRFRDVPSPLVLENAMRNALANTQGMSNYLSNSQQVSNALYTQRSSEFRSNRATGGGPGTEIDLPSDLTGSGGNDLFVYSLPKMSLKKGERATVPIMSTKVPYRDVFTWDLHVKHSETYVAPGSASQSPLVLSENKIWRQVELINDTKFPWTTGAVMFVDGFQPLAQELLTYTSPGGICRVPVTVAVDLRGKAEDSETGRKLEDIKWRGYNYAKVNGRIELEVANNKEEAVKVEVRLRFGGKAEEMSDDGKLQLTPFSKEDWNNYSGETAVNNSSHIIWETSVEPGECFKPTTDYHFYVRH